MQALILAAGFGKRLQPITNKIPKGLVEVNGTPLLINALDHLSGRIINEVIIVVGDKKEQIISYIGHEYKGMKITFVENPSFLKTNNVYSLWLAINYVHEDLIMLECDLFYDRILIDKIMEGASECNILVSPYDSNSMDGTVISVKEGQKVSGLYIKKHQLDGFNFNKKLKTVNIYKFKKEFLKSRFFPAVDLYVKTQDTNSYYELVLGSLIYFGNNDIKAIVVPDHLWSEIDNIGDLQRTESIYSKHVESKSTDYTKARIN